LHRAHFVGIRLTKAHPRSDLPRVATGALPPWKWRGGPCTPRGTDRDGREAGDLPREIRA